MVVVHLLTETFWRIEGLRSNSHREVGKIDLIALTLQKATAALYLKPTGMSGFSMSSTSRSGYATPRLNSKEESSCLWSISRVISRGYRTDTCS
jgi:hypothetical protein